MKTLLAIASIILLTLSTAYSQITRLSGRTGLYGILLNNKPLLANYVDSSLWTTDATVAGTKKITAKVKPVFPVFSSGTFYGAQYNGKFYFAGVTKTYGMEVWVTDGTDAGTKLVKDINSGTGSADVSNFVSYKGQLFFFANDGINGKELWVTDGTTGGTKLFLDINTSGSSYDKNTDCFFYP